MMNHLFISGILPVIKLEDMASSDAYMNALIERGMNTFLIDAGDQIQNISRFAAEYAQDAAFGVLYRGDQKEIREADLENVAFLVLQAPGSCCAEASIQGCTIIPTCENLREVEDAIKIGKKTIRTVGIESAVLEKTAAEHEDLHFIPVIKFENDIAQYANIEAVAAVECSWLKNGELAESLQAAKAARDLMMGYAFEHLGLNCATETEAQALSDQFHQAFGFKGYNLPGSIFVGGMMEVTKKAMPGENGHIAIRVHNVQRSIEDLERKGFDVDMHSAGYQNGKFISVYLVQRFGGFAVHLLKR